MTWLLIKALGIIGTRINSNNALFPFILFAARLFPASPPSRVGEPVRLGEHCQQRVGSRNYYRIRFGLFCGEEWYFVWHCFAVVYPRQRPSAPTAETQFFSMVPSRVFPSWLSGNKIQRITPAHLLSVTFAGGEKQKQKSNPTLRSQMNNSNGFMLRRD